jgi:hypothetical protein
MDLLPSQLPRTYTGLLDDAFIRYEGDYATEAFFNKMIAKSIFFGGYLYINDGYLLNHPLARRYLLNPNSLLREMIYAGFVRILCRDKEKLADLPDLMSGNRTFDELKASDVWEVLKPTWKIIADYVIDTDQVRVWPKYDMGEGFIKLIGNVWGNPVENLGFSKLSNEEFEQVREEFEQLNPVSGNARDKYERASAKVVGYDLLNPKNGNEFDKMRELMRPANEAYHNNFGMMLTLEEGDRGVAVDTTISASTDEIYQTDRILRGQLDNVELLRIPPTIEFDTGYWFHAFLNHTHPVGLAKLQYIVQLTEVVKATSNNLSAEQLLAAKKSLTEATREYYSRIAEHLKARYGDSFASDALDKERDVLITTAFNTKSSNRNSAFFAGADAGIVLALRDGSGNSGQGVDFLVNKLKNVEDVSKEFNPSIESVKFGDLRPQLASLAIDRNKAAEHAKGIKQFKSK